MKKISILTLLFMSYLSMNAHADLKIFDGSGQVIEQQADNDFIYVENDTKDNTALGLGNVDAETIWLGTQTNSTKNTASDNFVNIITAETLGIYSSNVIKDTNQNQQLATNSKKSEQMDSSVDNLKKESQAMTMTETDSNSLNKAVGQSQYNSYQGNKKAPSTASKLSYDDCKSIQVGFSQSYKGKCIDGLPSGKGIAKGKYGIYHGDFQNGVFHGKGKIDSHIVRNSYDGDFVDGKKHGEGYIYDSVSRTNRLAEFLNDDFFQWKTEASYEIDLYGDLTESSSEQTLKPNKIYVGKRTAYGTIVDIDTSRGIVFIESMSYNDDGKAIMEVNSYPLTYF